ncbi:Hypothetical predicted protein [Octopus vulgaris]|uniref:Uncharacterized protein n=1 Tax=Octopus vulgaris TaxID=6645 RepID=A0AA36F6C9_OCTVU|nr:Hypothetical predicted protein [Octopus vulgaris]
MLSEHTDDIEIQYNNLVKATDEISLSKLRKKERIKHRSIHADVRVREARKHLERSKLKYEQRPTKHNFKDASKAQGTQDEAYANVETDYILDEINKIANLHTAKQHAAIWKLITLTERKFKPSIRLEGGSYEKRKANWFAYFQKLLGESPQTNGLPLPLH